MRYGNERRSYTSKRAHTFPLPSEALTIALAHENLFEPLADLEKFARRVHQEHTLGRQSSRRQQGLRVPLGLPTSRKRHQHRRRQRALHLAHSVTHTQHTCSSSSDTCSSSCGTCSSKAPPARPHEHT